VGAVLVFLGLLAAGIVIWLRKLYRPGLSKSKAGGARTPHPNSPAAAMGFATVSPMAPNAPANEPTAALRARDDLGERGSGGMEML
jgi:hypothetical protein